MILKYMLWTKSPRMHHSLSKHDYYNFLIFVIIINLEKLFGMFLPGLVVFKAETHNATNRCDTSLRQVAATNRLV